MKAFKNGLDRFLAVVCIIDFIVMVLLTTYQVVVRYVFKSPSSVSEVLTRYCFVWLILLSATYVFGQRDHICITFLKDKLTGGAKRAMDVLIEVVVIIFAALILVYGGAVITTMNMLQYDSILKIPTGAIYGIIPVCGVLIIFYSLYNLVSCFKEEEGGK
ncbi:MAG: TRAP transporter small permease [Eubacteriales bacterium]|nr:TRAP transporter small permease [Eubacteriales bacterium]